MQRQIEADGFFFVTDTQAHQHVDQLEDHVGDDGGVHHGESYAFELSKELESADEDEGEELAAADDGSDDDGDGDDEVIPAAKGKAKAKAAVDVDDLPSVEAKQKERDALARAMEEFLARGGKVQEVDPNVVADPPKKPDSKYGSRPI